MAFPSITCPDMRPPLRNGTLSGEVHRTRLANDDEHDVAMDRKGGLKTTNGVALNEWQIHETGVNREATVLSVFFTHFTALLCVAMQATMSRFLQNGVRSPPM